MTYPADLRNKILYTPLILGSLVASFYLLGILKNIFESFSSVFTILILALFITIILKPVVDYLKKYGVSTILAITFAFVLLFAFFIVIAIFMIPTLVNELNLIANRLPYITSNQHFAAIYEKYNLGNLAFTNTLLSKINQLVDFALNNSFSLIQNIFTIILDLFISFFFAFYFLLEGGKFKQWIIQLLPLKYRNTMQVVTETVLESFQGFIKGQTLIAGIIAIATMILMQILGLHLVILSGVYVFFAMFIPVAGPFICILLPVAIAMLTSYFATILLVCILFILIQIVVNIIQPKIFSKSLGIHPVLAVLSVLIGAQALGFAGALFALPLASVTQSLITYYYKK